MNKGEVEGSKELRYYLGQFDEKQREYFPISFLLAKENPYGKLKPQRAKLSNSHYNTGDFETFEFHKNIAPCLPHSALEKIKE